MRPIRDKKISKMEPGDSLIVKKVSKPEFLIYAKAEVAALFAEGVSLSDPEKFADILEIINNVCDIIKIDWYECQKIKSSKRWEEGSYSGCMVAKDD